MRAWLRQVKPTLLAAAVYAASRLIGFTLRFRILGEEKLEKCKRGRIIAGWHGRTFMAALHFRNRGWWALISRSRDGDMQNGIFRRFGFRTIRGSTGRGGARAAAECVRVLRRGGTFVYTPDGPRGPARKVQRGVLWLAQKGGAAIIPAASSARPRKLLSSWDSYMVPAPFGRAVIVLGDPMTVPKDADEKQFEELQTALESEMNRLQQVAEAEMGFS
ncbi:MAG: lysophospholipid acyltransferase family protein [Armatimonadetes bacterium]|nr:lysophospholipid acyltransferase family protein [Armatimonadota bacterium]